MGLSTLRIYLLDSSDLAPIQCPAPPLLCPSQSRQVTHRRPSMGAILRPPARSGQYSCLSSSRPSLSVAHPGLIDHTQVSNDLTIEKSKLAVSLLVKR